jgi:hypothetical protein
VTDELRALVTRCSRHQAIWLDGLGVIAVGMGFAVLCAGVAIPAKRGELAAKLVVVAFGALFVPAGAGLVAWSRLRVRRLWALLGDDRAQVARVEGVVIRSRNARGYGVHVYTRDGAKVGVAVPDPVTQERLLAALREHLPGVRVVGPE